MLRTLKALFDDALSGHTRQDAADALPLAIAALLIEVSRADHEIDARERHAIVHAVAQVCAVDEAALEALVDSAEEAVEEAVSLYDFTSVVNERLPREEKYALLVLLWRVAHADGRLDHYEEYYVRRLADLLHLSHGDFIRAKHAAAERAGPGSPRTE
jgi:uncharacterized tellurite resistance protein B-like protein